MYIYVKKEKVRRVKINKYVKLLRHLCIVYTRKITSFQYKIFEGNLNKNVYKKFLFL